MSAGRQRRCAGSSAAEQSLGFLDEAGRPSRDLQSVGRSMLSLTQSSGLFLGTMEGGHPMPSEGQQWHSNFQLPHGAARRQRCPRAVRTSCLLIAFTGRDRCNSQGDTDLGSGGAFQPCQCPLPSLFQAVLHGWSPAPVALQAVGTISLPCLALTPTLPYLR